MKHGKSVKFRIYINKEDIDVENYKDVSLELLEKEDSYSIKDEYVELKKLVDSIEIFDSNCNISSNIPKLLDIDEIIKNKSMSQIKAVIDELEDIVRAIVGQYVELGKLDKANERLVIVLDCIETIEELIKQKDASLFEQVDFIKLKLWTAEVISNIERRNSGNISERYLKFISNLVKEIFEDIKDEKIIEKCIQEKDCFKYIESVCLVYNLLRIYENFTEDISIIKAINCTSSHIINGFWVEEKKVFRYSLKEMEIYSTPEMLYSLSLSYPVVIDKNIVIKLIDTAFKELYTPYGLRKYPASSSKYDGKLYPKYMSFFVCSNLRQNGITYASQKIAYNLAKELFQSIGKEVVNTVPLAYSEKGEDVLICANNLLTTAEMIRLYNMFI